MQNERQRHNHQGRTADRAQPLLGQRAPEIQPYGTLAYYPLALDGDARAASVALLNQILADTMVLRDLYKKHHWQVAGHTFYQLHLLFDKHYGEQSTLVDTLAERIQSLGGISVAMAHDVAEMTRIERPPARARRGARTALASAGSARTHHSGGPGGSAAGGRSRRRWDQ